MIFVFLCPHLLFTVILLSGSPWKIDERIFYSKNGLSDPKEGKNSFALFYFFNIVLCKKNLVFFYFYPSYLLFKCSIQLGNEFSVFLRRSNFIVSICYLLCFHHLQLFLLSSWEIRLRMLYFKLLFFSNFVFLLLLFLPCLFFDSVT